MGCGKSAIPRSGDRRNYLEIRAPFNGVITTRNVNPGAYVGPSGKGSEFPAVHPAGTKETAFGDLRAEAFTGYLNQQDKVKFNVMLPNEKFTAQVKKVSRGVGQAACGRNGLKWM